MKELKEFLYDSFSQSKLIVCATALHNNGIDCTEELEHLREVVNAEIDYSLKKREDFKEINKDVKISLLNKISKLK
jgi:hypothetical protein